MEFAEIAKDPSIVANMGDYAAARAGFSWGDVERELGRRPGMETNIGYLAVDRHAGTDAGARVALRWLGRRGVTRDYSFDELSRLTNRFANALRRLGIGAGDRVFALSGRLPELYVAAIGTLKNRSVFCPLFSAFGPEPIAQRMTLGDARVLVTTRSLYERKVRPQRSSLPGLAHVILIDGADGEPGTAGFHDLLAAESDAFEVPVTGAEDMALLHFTSGTTGRPKGAVHVHDAVLAHYITGKYALDLRPGDVFWCTADPGWVTGTSYGIVAPLALGVTSIIDEAEFDPARWYEILERERVNVWYTAPTAVRMLMKAGPDLPRGRNLSALRFVASVGEPLNPEGVVWGGEALGRPIHDNWWQTETGGIMVANFAAMPIRPGSMGKPLPGIEAAIVNTSGDTVRELTVPGEEGELALRPGWPSMFRGYLNDDERYARCFRDGWYLTGDLATRDRDGYFWFVGRADDVIKASGHLIGPFEVESALLEHPAVAEAAVIGKPDPIAGNIVKAFVALHTGYEPTEDLMLELLGFARIRLGPAVAPKEITFAESLPRTRSGKIMRRLLRAREMGLPEGDTSTLEGSDDGG